MNKENLKKLRDHLAHEENVAIHGQYYGDDNCRCVVGHIADIIGDEDIIASLKDNNGQTLRGLDIDPVVIADKFDIPVNLLFDLQDINDRYSSMCDDERKEDLIGFIETLL